MKLNPTKNALAPLIYQIALDEKMISSAEEARELEAALRAFDASTYERILKRRAESLMQKSAPDSNAFFSPDFYSEQAETINALIADLDNILS